MPAEARQLWSRRTLPWLALLLLTASVLSRAEQLPVRAYTTADGLPRDAVTHIEQDSRGFIWIIAGDGLSRFDGYRFTTYTTDDGLPDRRVNDLLETRDGTYWVATAAGLCRFNPTGNRLRIADFGMWNEETEDSSFSIRNPQSAIRNSGSPLFIVYNPDDNQKVISFNILLEDAQGTVWCGTSAGLYRLDVRSNGDAELRLVDLGMAREDRMERSITALLKDGRDFLWVGTESGALYRLAPDGHVEHYTSRHGLPFGFPVTALLEDDSGTIWAGTQSGLCRLVPEPDPSRPVVERRFLRKDGLASPWVMSLHETRDRQLWVATSAGLSLFVPAADGRVESFLGYNARNGLCDYEVWGVTDDRDGNLWVASRCGALKVMRNGLTGYGPADGLAASIVNSIFEDKDGSLFITNSPGARLQAGYLGRSLNRFDGAHFTSADPNLPASLTYHGWGWGQTITQDHLGGWWMPTGLGLYRFPRVDSFAQLARARPEQVHAPAGGLDNVEIFRLYEDSRGDLWIATTGRDKLWRWERATNTFQDLTAATNVAPDTDFTFFAEDHAGNLWIGTSESLLRYRDGQFQRFTAADGVPPGWIIWLYADHAGRLWIASQLGGLNRLDDPTAPAPHIQRYTTAAGLSSNNVRCITEDAGGRIYVGTGHGVDRLDPESGAVKHFTVAEGLPKGTIEQAYRDRQGALWFGSYFGVSRLVPERKEPRTPPSIYLTGLRVEGDPRRVSELGETELPPLELSADQRQLSIDFTGLGASPGEELSYQYRLEGAGNDWSAPTRERTVNYANLSPGTYRFLVRALNSDGQQSPQPATFAFTIAAPVWQRWWFWAAIALPAFLAAFFLYRSRVARILGVANMRTRIATDLHDDIGANLTRIAILSEVAKRRFGNGDGDGREQNPLTSIADIARESVASMGDIVWAINPERDSLRDLVRRMRQHADEVFTLRDIALEFDAPGADLGLRLGAGVRRDVLLIFKEAVNNAARHAHCSSVKVNLRADDSALSLTVADDGEGFDAAGEVEGHGLANMRRRARKLGGELSVESARGRGTTISLRVPRPRVSLV